jgi:hypothetical protein
MTYINTNYTSKPDPASEIRARRDQMIADNMWLYERYERETRLAIPHKVALVDIDTFMQELADVPEQEGFPDSFVTPTLRTGE